MHDPWIEKISASIDGQLPGPEEQALGAHLAECAECRGIATELRNVVAAAQEAGAVEPARDLWPGIAAAIGGGAARMGSSAAIGSPAEADVPVPAALTGRSASAVTPLHSGRTGRGARRFSFSMPQLAAAAVVLMALSGTAVWLVSAPPDAPGATAGTIIQTSGGATRSTQLANTPPSASPEYTEDVADLERALEQNRAQLDPATVEVIERSLESIDRAIEDARSALAADPGNPYLHRQLDNTMRKKIDVLRRATGAQRARS